MLPNYYKIYGYFKSDGNAYNIPMNDIPDIFTIYNLNSGANEIFKMKWFKDLGDSKCIAFKQIADNGATGGLSVAYVSSSGYITMYDSDSIQTTNPVTHLKGKGITISTSWLDDNDECYWEAEFNVPFIDAGDLGA